MGRAAGGGHTVAFLLALTALRASDVRAQPASPSPAAPSATPPTAAPPAPPLVPPRALDAPSVPYPKGAEGDAVVVLELVIDRDGNVIETRGVDGKEPFASAAMAAAPAWKFEPARRGEVTVAARVRMRVEFTRPQPSKEEDVPSVHPPPGERPAQPNAPSSPTPIEPPVEEVRVRGVRKEVGQLSMGGGEVRQIPGAFGDAFRAIEALPGVTPIVSGLPYFFVRGAPPGNTGYYLDGIRVPLLYHLAFGPSVVHPGLIERVDFHPGGYPARFGRFAGGILSGETLGPASRARAEWNVRLFDAGALAEAPFANGRGTVLVGGRYSYTAAMVSLFAPNTRLQYWDYQARATWSVTENDQLGIFAFGSYDALSERDGAGEPFEQLLATQFHRVDVRYDRRLGRGGIMRLAATLGVDRSGDDEGDLRDVMAALRVQAEQPVSKSLRLRTGADVVFDRYDLVRFRPLAGGRDLTRDETDSLYPPRNDVVMGAWADAVWKVSPRVEIVPGLRTDVFTSRRIEQPPLPAEGPVPSYLRPVKASAQPAIDPRLAVRIRLFPRTAYVSTFGVSHQPPAFFVPVPGLSLGRLHQGLQTSVQASQGLEIRLPADFTATPTAFLHHYLDMTDITATCGLGDESNVDGDDDCIADRVRGRTYGLELLVRRPLTKRITGWLSYTLSRSTREAHARGGLQEVPSEFDRTHVLNLVGAYDLGRGWRAGMRFFYYTGRPYTRDVDRYTRASLNRERLPAFYRADARLEKRWVLGQQAWISLVAEWMNFTLRKEAIGVDCDSDGTCSFQEVGPVTIPSLGLEGQF